MQIDERALEAAKEWWWRAQRSGPSRFEDDLEGVIRAYLATAPEPWRLAWPKCGGCQDRTDEREPIHYSG